MTVSTPIHPVILCGGSGTRLWPLSRQSYPKQFVPLTGRETLFQAAARRLSGPGFADSVIMTTDPFRFIVREQLAAAGVAPAAIVIEPEARNTAASVLAAALWVQMQDQDAVMLIAPSDHVIPDAAAFRAAVAAAVPVAEAGHLVTFGIRPTRAETGYGYLELSGQISGAPQPLCRFIEKPGPEVAADMLASGRYLWNAGVFLGKASAFIAACRAHAPGISAAVGAAMAGVSGDLGFTRIPPGPWAAVADMSFDYAVMEQARDLWVMPYAGAWSDLGSWEAVWSETAPDTAGNVCSDHARAIDCRNTLLRSEAEGLELVGIGLEDIVAVAMPDAVLVAHRRDGQRLKQAVATMAARGVPQATQFPRDHRPWGWFESIATGDRFQVKRIVVNPGAALSLQSHRQRAEHWVVVEGTARVTIDGTVSLIGENQSVYIPLGARHRLENPGTGAMVLIEIQTGRYFGEDDIIRYHDDYARE